MDGTQGRGRAKRKGLEQIVMEQSKVQWITQRKSLGKFQAQQC